MKELIKTLAFLFQRKGKEHLTEKEFIFSVSMDLSWFSPEEAKQLLDVCLELKLLTKEEGGFKPTFEYKARSIPLDFAPTKNILTLESQEPLLLSIVRSIESKTEFPRSKIMAEVNKKKDALEVEIEVAAILIAQKYGVDITGFLREAETEILKRSKTA